MTTIKKGSLNFNIIYQACKNILKLKDHRDEVTYLKIEDGIMFATDGRVLISCEVSEDFMNGYYRPLSIKKSEIIFMKAEHSFAYPDVKSLTNIEFRYESPILTFADHIPAHIAIKTGIPVSAEYTKIASNIGIYKISYNYNKSEPIRPGYNEIKEPIKCMCNGGVIYIMPIKID